jgi:hypothetical protein
MAHNEFFLKPGEALTTGQWLRSENGLFHAVIQEDGNFVVYRGDWKDAKEVNTHLWSTIVNDAKGKSYTNGKKAKWTLYMQGDGNMIISEPGGSPVWALTTNHRDVMARENWAVLADDGNFFVAPEGKWNDRKFATDATDTVDESSYEWDDIAYDLAAAKITELGPPRHSYALSAINDTSIQQSATLTMTYAKSTTRSCKLTTTLKVSYKSFTKFSFPGIGETGVEMAAEASQGFEWNTSWTETETIAVTQPVLIPPHKKIAGKCTWHESSLNIPFKGRGKVTFRGIPKVKIPVHIEGVYNGTQTHSVVTSWTELDVTQRIDEKRPQLHSWHEIKKLER